MANSIQIVSGKLGVFLKVDGYAIKRISDGSILVTPCYHTPNMWIGTEFSSVESLREFWNKRRKDIVSEVFNYKGVILSRENPILL